MGAMAKKQKNKLKLPKRLLGVKTPKQTRKSLNRLLSLAPEAETNKLVAAAVGSLLTVLAERLEQPLRRLTTIPQTTSRSAKVRKAPEPQPAAD
jgi:hypothetical protein